MQQPSNDSPPDLVPAPPRPPRTLGRELRGILVLYIAIAVLPILVGHCTG